MLLLFLTMACRDKDDAVAPESPTGSPADSPAPEDPSRWTGEREDEGFGASLVADASGVVWVGAPFGETGRVYTIEGVDTVLRMEKPDFSALGLGLALTSEGVVAGAPLAADRAGELVGTSGTIAEGQPGALMGARIAVYGETVAATTATGVWLGDAELILGERPGDIAYMPDGRLYVGIPQSGDLGTDGSRYAIGAPLEEAGSALCVADLDGDGADEIAVGAPGAGRVYLVSFPLGEPDGASARILELGSGRFGASLACSAGELVVGAPTFGEAAGGAVWALDADALASGVLGLPLDTGLPGSDLGAAVLWLDGAVWAGAPGESAVYKLR